METSGNLSMSVALLEADESVLLVLSGIVDIITVSSLVEVLIPLCAEPPAEVVIDLSDLDFLGLSGIAAIIDAAFRLDIAGCTLRLVGTSPLIHRVLLTLGVSDLVSSDYSD